MQAGFRPRGHIVGVAGKDSDKYRYDNLVCRQSTYWGIFEEGHSSACAGENQRDVSHAAAKAKSDALCDGAWHAGVRSPTTPCTLRSLTPAFATRLAECRPSCQNRRPSLTECFLLFMHDFIHGCINVFQVTSTKNASPVTSTPSAPRSSVLYPTLPYSRLEAVLSLSTDKTSDI